jgi:hypothetical protein
MCLEEANNYAQKIFKPIELINAHKYKHNQSSDVSGDWLIQAKDKFSTLPQSSGEMTLAIGFEPSGTISRLRVLNIAKNISQDELKTSLAQISSIKLPANNIFEDDNLYFEYYSQYKFLDFEDIPQINQPANTLVATIKSQTNKLEDIERVLLVQGALSANLAKPDFLEYPYIGQPIEFLLPLLEETKISGHIKDLDNSSIKIKFSEISNKYDHLITDLEFRLDQDSTDLSVLGAKILGTALSSASSAGFLGSALTNGILPGAFAVLGTASVLADEHQKNRPFCLSKGQEVKLKMEEKQ